MSQSQYIIGKKIYNLMTKIWAIETILLLRTVVSISSKKKVFKRSHLLIIDNSSKNGYQLNKPKSNCLEFDGTGQCVTGGQN